MPSNKNITLAKICLILAGWLFLSISYTSNMFGITDDSMFNNFQNDSESLVLGRVLNDRFYPDNTEKFNLGNAHNNGSVYEVYTLFENGSKPKHYKPYISHIGLQGSFYSYIAQIFRVTDTGTLKTISAVLTALSLVILSLLFIQIYGLLFGSIFFISIAFSPWMTAIASNLYWSPFTWFIPSIFSFLAYRNIESTRYKLCLALFFFAVLVKSLCGYEYLSSLLILASSPFLIKLLSTPSHAERKAAFKTLVTLFVLSVCAFAIALLAHANLRADSLISGLNDIWQHDVLRRTYGNAPNFDPGFSESLNADVMSVMSLYTFEWNTSILKGVSGDLFPYMLLFSFLLSIYTWLSKKHNSRLFISMFVIYIAAPISWFVLAKSHSYIHTHINFVLWYFGLIGACLYILTLGSRMFLHDYVALCKRKRGFILIFPTAAVVIFSFAMTLQNTQFASQVEHYDATGTKLGVAHSGHKLYWLDINKLAVITPLCSAFPEQAQLIIKLHSEGSSRGKSRESSEGAHTKWEATTWQSNQFSKNGRECIFTTALPTTPIKTLSLKVHSIDDGSKKPYMAKLTKIKHPISLATVSFSTPPWSNGIHTKIPAVLLKNTYAVRQNIFKGDKLGFANSGSRTIKEIKYIEDFMVVILSGKQTLSDSGDGHPKPIELHLTGSPQ
mgnify:CR=1 FL=1